MSRQIYAAPGTAFDGRCQISRECATPADRVTVLSFDSGNIVTTVRVCRAHLRDLSSVVSAQLGRGHGHHNRSAVQRNYLRRQLRRFIQRQQD
jgi:hypothetical protein